LHPGLASGGQPACLSVLLALAGSTLVADALERLLLLASLPLFGGSLGARLLHGRPQPILVSLTFALFFPTLLPNLFELLLPLLLLSLGFTPCAVGSLTLLQGAGHGLSPSFLHPLRHDHQAVRERDKHLR
jgi:hypothetical protein